MYICKHMHMHAASHGHTRIAEKMCKLKADISRTRTPMLQRAAMLANTSKRSLTLLATFEIQTPACRVTTLSARRTHETLSRSIFHTCTEPYYTLSTRARPSSPKARMYTDTHAHLIGILDSGAFPKGAICHRASDPNQLFKTDT